MKQIILSALLSLMLISPIQASEHSPFTLNMIPLPLPDISFRNDANKVVSLADYSGKYIVLNFWATWCAPCLAEMPTLDNLEGQLGGDDFQVLALSIDRAGDKAVRKFYAKTGIKNLTIVLDQMGEVGRGFKVQALPTTILLDPKGRELGRFVGSTDWDTPEMLSFFKDLIKREVQKI